jgi:hypothetical protein
MNIIEMQDACDLLLDKANSPWYTSTEKDDFLNRAHHEFAETRYRNFEKDERTRKELLPLVRTSSGANTDTVNYSAISDFMFTLSLSGIFNKPCGVGTALRSIHPLQIDDEFTVEEDPFNKSADDNPNYVEENNGTDNVAIIKSDTTPISYKLKYLMIPTTVFRDVSNPANNVDSIMPIFTHDEIVSIAVRMMMANTEQIQNYQLQQNEIRNEN